VGTLLVQHGGKYYAGGFRAVACATLIVLPESAVKAPVAAAAKATAAVVVVVVVAAAAAAAGFTAAPGNLPIRQSLLTTN